MSSKLQIIKNCRKILQAYKDWELGYMKMPEDENPWFDNSKQELCLTYFTLPMSLNYQRNSYTLWQAALQTYNDPETQDVFDINQIINTSKDILREKLLKYKLALQPNKHIDTWYTITNTIYSNRWSIDNLLKSIDYDFLKLKYIFEKQNKKWLPYISWPKIFNYRSSILQSYCNIKLKNSEFIEIALDTHVSKASIKLWIITQTQADTLPKEQIYIIRRELLWWTWINPADMHSPLWFWSRNNFLYQI